MKKLENQKLIRFGKKNKNGRIYLKDEFLRDRVWSESSEEYIIGSLIERLNGIFYRKKKDLFGTEIKINDGSTVLGEFGYPEDFIVTLTNVTHSIDNFRIHGNWLIGDVTILKTAGGEMLNDLLDNNLEFVFRPRGMGNVNERGEITDYSVCAFDAIPKKDDAFL